MFRKGVIAALVGSTFGAAGGYLYQPADTHNQPHAVTAASPPIAAPADPASRLPAEPTAVEPQPQQQQPAPMASDSPGVGVSNSPAVQRARLLAERPDVNGLVALREEVLRVAQGAGEKESPATTQQLVEIDRYLTAARLLRLKLDAAEFRK